MLDRLRHRLVFATFCLVVGVAALFCVGTYTAFELAEDNLFDTHLARDVASLMTLYERDPSLVDVEHENFQVFMAPNGSTAGLPAHIAALAMDADDLVHEGHEYRVEIHQRGATRFYFLFDESTFESFTQIVFVTMSVFVVGIVITAGWISIGLSKRVIHPLTQLAREVASLDDNAETGVSIPSNIAADDEITQLANAINGYHGRINELLHREREFSSDVSHELRTPLMAVQGAAELLERRSVDHPAMIELTARIRRGCLHMTTLTEALLYLARDPSIFKDMIEPVSIERVVATQIAAVREITDSKGIVVNVEKAGDAATVVTIPAVANIVIGNILKNAVKYTNRDVISVYLTEHEVIIQDYGPGIDAAVQGTLFDRFNRGENRNSDGTGIGLALVRRFCDQYGWVIDFHSEMDKGTRIAVAF